MAELETLAALPEGNRAPTKPPMEKSEDLSRRAAAVVEPHASAASLDDPDAFPFVRCCCRRREEAKAPAAARKPRKPKLQDQPIQISVYNRFYIRHLMEDLAVSATKIEAYLANSYSEQKSNIADAYKHDPVLKDITRLPLSAIVKVTCQRVVKYFENASAAANKAIADPSMNFPERDQDDMNSEMQKAQIHQVICIDTNSRNGFVGEEDVKYAVQSGKKRVLVHLNSEYKNSMNNSQGCKLRKTATCSCNKPQLLRKPCSHVIAVCYQIGVSTATYMSPYYSLTYLGRTWSGELNVSKTSRKYRYIMPFEVGTLTWIPDKKLECGLPVSVTSEEEQQCIIGSGSIPDNQGNKTLSEEPSHV